MSYSNVGFRFMFLNALGRVFLLLDVYQSCYDNDSCSFANFWPKVIQFPRAVTTKN